MSGKVYPVDIKDEWVSFVECHLCKKQTPTKESSIIDIPKYLFGINGNGFMNSRICKECHREEQLNKLF
jgi:hypothetical protein